MSICLQKVAHIVLTLDYIPSSCIIIMHVVKGRRYSVYTITDEVDGDESGC